MAANLAKLTCHLILLRNLAKSCQDGKLGEIILPPCFARESAQNLARWQVSQNLLAALSCKGIWPSGKLAAFSPKKKIFVVFFFLGENADNLPLGQIPLQNRVASKFWLTCHLAQFWADSLAKQGGKLILPSLPSWQDFARLRSKIRWQVSLAKLATKPSFGWIAKRS